MIWALIQSLRPKQWIKNLLLFAGVIFTANLKNPALLGRSFAGFVIFCLLSGVVYLINDLKDARSDRNHPVKKNRPIASGRLSPGAAYTAIFLLGIPSLVASFYLGIPFGICAASYVILVTLYSLYLKHYVILDLMMVAMGFVIRAIAGIEVIATRDYIPEITPWFIACALFLALFLAICKRRHEILLLNNGVTGHRPVLEEYSPAFLDQMVAISTTATIISYALWSTIGKFAHYRMIFTLPFVLYGIFRYLYLVYKKEEGGAPEALLLKDRSLLIDILLWLFFTIFLLYLYNPKG
ncbi:decaprenyl-phosphate phosphoribosyltransferase [Candidatus Sumerlaeota bacterium]|nr:decaprenyl-phosphate phosphoribosyltransferase [Candidatus Sumerlaeota bacterium]